MAPRVSARSKPGAALTPEAAEVPEEAQRARQAYARLRVRLGTGLRQTPGQSGAQVVVFGCQPGQRGLLRRPLDLGRRRFGQRQVVGRVAPADQRRLSVAVHTTGWTIGRR